MIRSSEFEVEATRSAGRRWGVGTEVLSQLAQVRADEFGGSVDTGDNRDFGREVAEELADARNYLCWQLQQGVEDDERREDFTEALGAVARAFHHLYEARRVE